MREQVEVQQYYNKVITEDLREKRFIKLITDLSSIADSDFDKIVGFLIRDF